jgi:hypothetical protein
MLLAFTRRLVTRNYRCADPPALRLVCRSARTEACSCGTSYVAPLLCRTVSRNNPD